ncbi:Phosphoserine phosphatase 1 [Rubripirellula amarantea]|uniref:Phosphoserine phosphatase 1 n=1 Tax=Rubripirellula amarantea TaxID=2527999 RepID=A0A5C5WWA4_9BACT|nr:histidine phosphatase family protein [Rubripirellula amarantea]TWT54142.1 Phosphoserine phosphatase 1 [Rubripirellula amarantea]
MIALKSLANAPVLLIRPGCTEFDEQRRIKGSLDMPLSEAGHRQVESMTGMISDFRPKIIYTAPCESAVQTAERLAKVGRSKVKIVDALRNVDHGLWHGKLIEELKRNNPKLYRRGQESPDDICPPGGESFLDARLRIEKAVRKLLKKSGGQLVAIVVPDPLAQIVQNLLSGEDMFDLWQAETDSGRWDLIEPVT